MDIQHHGFVGLECATCNTTSKKMIVFVEKEQECNGILNIDEGLSAILTALQKNSSSYVQEHHLDANFLPTLKNLTLAKFKSLFENHIIVIQHYDDGLSTLNALLLTSTNIPVILFVMDDVLKNSEIWEALEFI
jgi:hypothetical protein